MTRRNAILNKSIDAEYSYDIVWRDFACWVIFTRQLWNPWQTLAEPLGSMEPRLKITVVRYIYRLCGWMTIVCDFTVIVQSFDAVVWLDKMGIQPMLHRVLLCQFPV